MLEYIIDNEQSLNDLKDMLASGEAKILSMINNNAEIKIGNDLFNIEFTEQYKIENNIDRVIYGKNDMQNITNISYRDGYINIFTLGNEITIPHKPWALSPKFASGYIRLKGNQHYKFIKEYSADEYERVKSNFYKYGIYTQRNPVESFMIRHGYTYFKGMKPSDLSLLSFDIETTGLDPRKEDAKVLLITNTIRTKDNSFKKTFNVEDYSSQVDMILDWVEWTQQQNPNIILGHNIVMFDIPYLSGIMFKNDLTLNLGKNNTPIEIEEHTRELRKDGSQSYSYNRINIFGRDIVDTFFLAIKTDIARKYESYNLKSIIKQEGLEKEDRQHYDAAKIKDFWHDPNERKKIIQYAEDDSEDPIKLYDIMIAPIFYLTRHVPKTFQLMIESATGSQVNSMMIRSYLQDGFCVAKADDEVEYEGAVSFGNPGIYKYVKKEDVSSLYPSIMRNYKISPGSKDFNGNFLKMLEFFTLERLTNKKLAKETGDRYYKDLEQTQKILINSSYGFLGASGLNYNNPTGAAEVTRRGRDIIIKSIEWATGHTLVKVIDSITNEGKENEKKHYKWILGDKVKEGKGLTLVNGDTDSISYTFNKEISKKEMEDLRESLNNEFPDLISWEDDGYYPVFIVLKAKNYIMKTEDGKIKLKGSSIRDQKKEPALKEMLNKMIECLVNSHPDDVIKIYEEYISECLNLDNISRWATKKTITKSVLNCATDPDARLNERKVYDAIKNTHVQEGDKVYLYPAILNETIEVKEYKNGNKKEKVIRELGLKLVSNWTGDHDEDKLVERVYDTVQILSNVLDTDMLINYTLKKNKDLLTNK